MYETARKKFVDISINSTGTTPSPGYIDDHAYPKATILSIEQLARLDHVIKAANEKDPSRPIWLCKHCPPRRDKLSHLTLYTKRDVLILHLKAKSVYSTRLMSKAN